MARGSAWVATARTMGMQGCVVATTAVVLGTLAAPVAGAIEWSGSATAAGGGSVPICEASDEYFDISTLECRVCPHPEMQEVDPTGRGCWCRLGWASVGADPYGLFISNATATSAGAEGRPTIVDEDGLVVELPANDEGGVPCERCPENLATDSRRLTCMPCSEESTNGYNPQTRRCSCPAGRALVHYMDDTRLAEAICVACAEYSPEFRVGPHPNNVEQVCKLVEDCPIAAGLTTRFNGICLPAMELGQVNAEPGGLVRYRDGTAFQSDFLQTQSVAAAVRCLAGVQGPEGCEYLANLCALQVYDVTQGACKLYWRHLTEIEKCELPLCEQPSYLPWLFYQTPAEGVVRMPLPKNFIFGEPLRLVVNVYRLDGTLLRTTELLDELFICDVPDPVANYAFKYGNNVQTHCEINPRWLEVAAPEPLFFDVFIASRAAHGANITFQPVPVRVYDHGDDDSVFYTSYPFGALPRRGLVEGESQLYRRVALWDNVLSDVFIRYARRVSILVAKVPGETGKIYVPLISVDYDYFARGEADAGGGADAGGASSVAFIPRTILTDGLEASLSVYYIMDQDRETLLAFIITSCCLAVVSSLVKAWAWQRRLNTTYINPFGAMIRWFIYYCSHLSTYFFLVLTGTCLWYFIWFKGQKEASVLLPPPSRMDDLFLTLLWTAFACRLVDVLYRVAEQCSMWVFFLDWEQPRGKLPAENRDIPVSMWRMVFASNAFNQLQSQLTFKLYATLILVILLLEPVGLLGLTTAQPDGDDLSLQGSYSHPVLRVGVSVVIWYGLTIVLWMYEVGVYHRFMSEDTVLEFVNLLSLANVSMFCLLERRWGYYIHGKSVHQFCEANVREFQEMLRREEQGAIPMRGLTGQSDAQVYELLADDAMERMLWELQGSLAAQRIPTQSTRPKRCYEYFLGRADRMLLSQQCLRQLQDLNRSLQSLVTKNADEVKNPTQLHQNLGILPSLPPHSPTSFYMTEDRAWYRVTLYYLESALSNLALLLFVALDYRFDNIFASMSAAFILIYAIQVTRAVCGSTNLARKTLLDDRFFL